MPQSIKGAKRAVDDYHAKLETTMLSQENERDKAVVLITSGALTVSFAFIATFVQQHGLMRLPWLIAAWSCWVAALIGGVLTYSLSLSAFRFRITAISEGRWSDVRTVPFAGKIVEPANVLVIVAMIFGFVNFGYFAIGNLQGIQNAKEHAAAKTLDPPSAAAGSIQASKYVTGGTLQSAETAASKAPN